MSISALNLILAIGEKGFEVAVCRGYPINKIFEDECESAKS